MFYKIIRYGAFGTAALVGTDFTLDTYFKKEKESLGLVRFGRAAYTAASIAFDYKWNLFNIDSNSNEYEEILSKTHLKSAKSLKDAFCQNGGVFIKVGQHIGGLDYLLPMEYVKTMKELHNKAPESHVSELFETIEVDLKCKISDIFKEIDPKPIGTASLAQCHKAILKDGTVVAVKIQHPSVKKNSKVDIKTMTFLVNCLAKIFPKFTFVWLAEETERNLPIELDFLNEGKNIEKVASIFRKHKFVKVPKVYWEYSSDRVLTMEYCEGNRIDDLESLNQNKVNVNKLSERLGIIFSEMIFLNGFVHCDPHPGNVLVNKVKGNKSNDFEVVLLDHGLYQSLSKPFRYNYAKIWLAILNKDIKQIEELTKNYFNVGEYSGLFACIITGRSWDSITKGIDKVKFSHAEGLEIKSEAATYLREISEVLNKVPREMLLLLKTNDLLRGIETALQTRNSSSSFFHLTKCCIHLINSYERELNKNDLIKRYNLADEQFHSGLIKKLLSYLYDLTKFNLSSYLNEQFNLFKVFAYGLFLLTLDS